MPKPIIQWQYTYVDPCTFLLWLTVSEKYIFSSDRRRTVYLFYTSWFTCGLRSVQLMYSCVQSEDCAVLVAHLWLQWGSLPVLYRPLVTPSSEPWSPQQWHEASTDNTPSLRTPVTQSSAQIRVRVNKQQPEDSPISNSQSSRNLRNWTNVTTFGKKKIEDFWLNTECKVHGASSLNDRIVSAQW